MLARGDAMAVRFFASLSLVEYCLFWFGTTDGNGITRALRLLAGYTPAETAWGSGFASRLSICEPMRALDVLPIFGRSPVSGPHTLFEFKAELTTPSDIRGWKMRDGESETLAPLPPQPKKSARANPLAAGPPPPDPTQLFNAIFHATAREVLDGPSFEAIEQFTRERLGVTP
jgi:hypothetical protein